MQLSVSYRPSDKSGPEFVNLVIEDEKKSAIVDLPTGQTVDGFESMIADTQVVVRNAARRIFERMMLDSTANVSVVSKVPLGEAGNLDVTALAEMIKAPKKPGKAALGKSRKETWEAYLKDRPAPFNITDGIKLAVLRCFEGAARERVEG